MALESNQDTQSSKHPPRCQKQPCYDFDITPALCELCQGVLFAQSPIQNPGKEENYETFLPKQ